LPPFLALPLKAITFISDLPFRNPILSPGGRCVTGVKKQADPATKKVFKVWRLPHHREMN
jgi:hypothetical protein